MYQNENFQEVASLSGGELVMKLPGTDVRMPFDRGIAYVNAAGNAGHLALYLNNIVAEASEEPAEGMMATLGEMLREQLSTTEAKKILKQVISQQPLHLFYSKTRTKEGTEILTLPGMGSENLVDYTHIEGIVVATYTTKGNFPSVEKAYALHGEAVGEKRLIADRKLITKETKGLVKKANQVYKTILEVIKENPLF